MMNCTGDGRQRCEPVSVADGAVVTCDLRTVGGTLVLDDTTVDDPGDYGFEYAGHCRRQQCEHCEVALDGTDAVP
jgi:hypothetical protein